MGEVTLFTRPRRFGKTLNMSMLKSFFEIGADAALFEGLYIAKNKELCDVYMGKYPVIFLTLKGVEGLTFADAKRMLGTILANEMDGIIISKQVMHLRTRIRHISLKCLQVRMRI